MKAKSIILAFFLLGIQCGFAQTILPDKRKSVCSSYILSPCAQSLIQSYRDLVSKPNSTLLCNATSDRKTYVTQSAMLTNCLYAKARADSKASGYLTFPSFYMATGKDELGSDKHHFYSNFTGNSQLGYSFYFGACPPTNFSVTFGGDPDSTTPISKMPVVYPYPKSGNYVNEVFSVQFISIIDYRNYRRTATQADEITALGGNITGLPNALLISDIEEIQEAYIEGESKYIALNQALNYNELDSSKGIIVNIKVKGRGVIKCYLINNYDGGTVSWKMKNYIP